MQFQQEGIVLDFLKGIFGSPLQIRYYGLIIVFAMLVAATVAARLAKRDGKDPEHVWGGLTWAIIPGIIFARLWFVLFPPATLTAGCVANPPPGAICHNTAWMLQNFFDLQNGAIAIWTGGLGIWGAVIGGFLGAYLYIRRNKLNLGEWMDIAAVVLPIGQAIGRWANYVNQELYGSITNLPWGITIDSAHRVAPYTSTIDFPVATTRFHPLFLYESLWNVLAFIVLLNLFLRQRRRFLPGDLFLVYVMQYTAVRFLLEFLRAEPAYVPGTTINSSQTIAVIAFVGALVFFLYRHRPGAVAAATPQPEPPQTEKQSA
jgi:phosphatidylglycerol:prolipoprotein diacylglycerol transferase